MANVLLQMDAIEMAEDMGRRLREIIMGLATASVVGSGRNLVTVDDVAACTKTAILQVLAEIEGQPAVPASLGGKRS